MTTSECEFGAGVGKSAVDYLDDFIIWATRLSPEEQEVWNMLCKKHKHRKTKQYQKRQKRQIRIKNKQELLLKRIIRENLKMKIEYPIKPKITINPELLLEDAGPLTDAENKILELLLNGYGVDYIADKLCISLTTIKTHISNIYQKKHVHNLQQLCVKCFWEDWQKPKIPKKKEIKDIDYKKIKNLLKMKI